MDDQIHNSDSLREQRLQSNKMKEFAFTFMCFAGGILAIVGICLSVVFGVRWFLSKSPPTGSTSIVYAKDQNGNDVEVDLNDPNVKVRQVGDQLYIEVVIPSETKTLYVNDKDVSDIVLGTEDTSVTEDTTSESTEADATVDSTETDTSKDDVTESTTETADVTDAEGDKTDKTGTDESDKDETETIKNDKASKDQEAELLKEMNERIANGESGYLKDDRIYEVKDGDTLTKISHLTGFSIDFLAEYNHIKNRDLIITTESIRYPKLK